MLSLLSAISAHCDITFVGMDGKYVSPRNDDPEKSWYPLDQIFQNADSAVCHGTKKGESIFTVKGGDVMSLNFRPNCNSGTDSSGTDVIQEGKTVHDESGSESISDARHGGGMCEISIAYEENPKWSDFIVLKRWKGTCPDSKLDWKFDLPKDLPNGEATMQWTWFNAYGKAELYSQCWDVTVESDSDLPALEGDCVAYGNTDPSNEMFFIEGENPGTQKYHQKPGNLETDVFTIPTKLADTTTCVSGGLKEVGTTEGTAGSISSGASYSDSPEATATEEALPNPIDEPKEYPREGGAEPGTGYPPKKCTKK